MSRSRKKTETATTATTTSDSDPKPVVESAPATDLAAERAEAMRNEERPSGRSSSSSTERVRQFRERKKAAAEAPPPISDAEIADAAGACATIWSLAVVPLARGRIKELNEDQASRLGRVTAPLVRKYIPLFGDFKEEALAALVLGVIIRETYVAPAKVVVEEEPTT
jgi:hypothetical protein